MAIDHAGTGRPPGARFGRFYTGAWGLLAAISVAYLGTLSLRPDVVAGLTPPAHRGVAETNEQIRAGAQATAEFRSLRETVAELQRHLEQTRESLGSEQAQAQALRTRLAAVEERAQKLQAVADARPAPKLTVAQKAAEARAASARAAPAPAAAAASVPIETASIGSQLSVGALPSIVNAPATAAGEAQGVATRSVVQPSPIALQLGGGPSLDALRLSWSLLSERHGTVLRNLAPRYVGAGTDDAPYQLIAGPVVSAAEAERLCTVLKARRIACAVAGFKGDAL